MGLGYFLIFLLYVGVAIWMVRDSYSKKVGFTDGPYTVMNGWLGWGIFCVFLPGPAWLWYLFRRLRVIGAREVALAPVTTSPVTCESCGGGNSPGAAYCKWCARPLVTGAADTVIATFGPSTAWVGKKITRDHDEKVNYGSEVFVLEGHGAISANDIMEYDRLGHLVWASDGTRAWIASKAQASAPARASTAAADSAVKTEADTLDGAHAAAETHGGTSPSSSEPRTTTLPSVSDVPTAAMPTGVPGTSLADEIAKLAALHDGGHLTDEEFATLKAKLMA